jgi:tripeptidyl-peptidase-1
MRTGLLLAAGLLAGAANGKPIRSRTPYVVKDSHNVPAKWTEVGPASPSHVIELRLALKQDQFQELERQLYEGELP